MKPWETEKTASEPTVETVVLNPWEAGYDVNKLPKSVPPKRHYSMTEGQRKKQIENLGNKNVNDRPPEERSALVKAGIERKRQQNLNNIKSGTTASIHVKSAAEKFEERGWDPMDLLMDVAQGKALYDDHPFLPILFRYLNDISERFEFQDGYGVMGLMDQLRVEAQGYLVDSYTPKEHRIKVAQDLLQYQRPKLKQTEHINRDGDKEECGQATPLTEEEVVNFKNWFNEEY